MQAKTRGQTIEVHTLSFDNAIMLHVANVLVPSAQNHL